MQRSAGVIPFIFAISCLFLTISTKASECFLDSTEARLLNEGQALLFNDKFASVDSLYSKYIEDHPEDPAGYLFKAAALMGEMSDQEENLHEPKFRALLDSVEFFFEQQIEATPGLGRAWLFLLRGHAKAYMSLWESRFGSFVSAIKLGMAARKEYSKGLEADSTCFDLYLGLGSYHYWKSAKGGLLRTLRILKNEKDKGIGELYLAMDSSLLSKEAARSALIWVWLNEKQYDSAVVIGGEFMAKYPEGKSFLWPVAAAQFKLERYEEALDTYHKLRERIILRPGNRYNLVECDHYITLCLKKLGRQEKASAHARAIHQYYTEIPSDIRKRQKSKIVNMLRLAGS